MSHNSTTTSDKINVQARGTQAQSPSNEATERLKRKYDKAYFHISQALTHDEQKQAEQAIDHYVKGIRYMNSALGLWADLKQQNPREAQESRMAPKIEKMAANMTKAQRRVDELLKFVGNGAIGGVPPVISHDGNVTASAPSVTTLDPPPSYNAAMAQQRTRLPSIDDAASAMSDATMLLFIESGVQIYFISNSGNVSAPSYPSSLAIYQFADRANCQSTANSPPAFLLVNDWIYPLMPNVSPVLHADWGAYVFPDLTAREPDCFVGVIVPDTLDSGRRKKLEEILQTFTNFREQVPDAEAGAATDTTGTISKGILTAAEWISWGVTKGAEKAGGWVKYGSDKLRQHIEPQNESSKIDPRVQKGAQYVRGATGNVVKVSGYIVDKVGEASSALAKMAAPHIRKTSETLMPESWTRKNPTDGRSTVDKISEVATTSLKGFSTVYLGLERSAMILAKSVTEQTVQTVQHKYGQDAGQLTEDVVYSTTNVVMAASSMNRLGAMAVARQVAKETGKEVVKQGQNPNGQQPVPTDKTHPPTHEKKQATQTGTSCQATNQSQGNQTVATSSSKSQSHSSKVSSGKENRGEKKGPPPT